MGLILLSTALNMLENSDSLFSLDLLCMYMDMALRDAYYVDYVN